jgi:NADPH-dependent ferric siderophore reductase
MPNPNMRVLTVVRSTRLTPNMQRITFGGDSLADFPEGRESSYFKLQFIAPPQKKGITLKRRIKLLLKRILGRKEWVARSYTVRHFDAAKRELDVDFVLHEHGGPASNWARAAAPGDQIVAVGHGPNKLVDMGSDWFLFVGDMSALPAIGANIEKLPRDARGHAFIEIIDEADRQKLDSPAGLEIQWLVNPDHERSRELLLDKVRGLQWQSGRIGAWVAGELGAIRAVRDYLKRERGVERAHMYASSYWQIGRTDEQHRAEKSRDPTA